MILISILLIHSGCSRSDFFFNHNFLHSGLSDDLIRCVEGLCALSGNFSRYRKINE